MTEKQIALAKRAVESKAWKLMPGMLVHVGFRVVWVDETTFRSFDERGNEMYGSTDCLLPDLTDPATLGCLLALVREAWNDAKVHVLYVDGLYRWECADRHNVHGSGMTEAEALIDALEYAT